MSKSSKSPLNKQSLFSILCQPTRITEPVFLSVKYLWRQCVPLSIDLLPSLPHELPELLVAGGGDVDGVVLDLSGLQDVQYRLLSGLHLDLTIGVKWANWV